MAESTGEKTEQPTQRKLEDALKKGQIPQSAEVQTVFVLLGGFAAMTFAGREIWQQFVSAITLSLGHLHDTTITANSLQGDSLVGLMVLMKCAGPFVLATSLGGLLAGAIQNRFNTAPEVLTPDWNRVNPVAGLGRIFSGRMFVPTLVGLVKFVFILGITSSEIMRLLSDPIFTSAVSTAHLAEFMGETCLRILLRVSLGLVVIAAADYAYQFWQTQRDLMMTKQELKDEMKNSESNQHVKTARRKRRAISKAKALAEVPNADVIVTNPTRIAIALRYDRKVMRAPKIVAKGIRLNAKKIREIAEQHQVPILENKPLAQMLFKHGRVGGEIPAQLYAAVAEVLAWVYRVNRYRYFAEKNQT
ncbi:MAG TPA: EscU/YscU/HrcU family type III secretion system export apparatus switch protein [Candidatus Angelobacter sp.]|nr:EscU/YscU/HrcU family type III secretion system export apparatus switch protein [Candidatus Angelobacter sp.]